MSEKSSAARLWPAVAVFAVMAVSFFVYNNSWRIDNRFLHQALANVFALTLFLAIGFGPLAIYPLARMGGAGRFERIAACLCTPLLWAVKEAWRVSAAFSLAESLYFMLNPLIIGVLCGAAAQMGLAEILCRRAMKKGGEDVKVFHVPAVAALAGGLFIVVFMLAWGLGVHSFYIFQEGYKAIFGFRAGL